MINSKNTEYLKKAVLALKDKDTKSTKLFGSLLRLFGRWDNFDKNKKNLNLLKKMSFCCSVLLCTASSIYKRFQSKWK